LIGCDCLCFVFSENKYEDDDDDDDDATESVRHDIRSVILPLNASPVICANDVTGY